MVVENQAFMPGKTIRLVSWNVNGLRAAMQKDFFPSVRRLNPDILALQETKLQDHQMYFWWSHRSGARKTNAGWRIDYFFVSRSMFENNMIREPYIDNDITGSDHCPVGLVIAL